MQAVLGGVYLKAAAADANGVVGFDAVLGGGYLIAAAGDLEIVLGRYAVALRGAYLQRAGAVEHKVILGEDDRIGVGVAVRAEGAGHRKGVGAALGGGDEALIRAYHVDRREIAVGDADVIQHQLHLGLAVHIHSYSTVGGCALDDIHALGGDVDSLAVGDRQGLGLGGIGGLLEVAVGEELRGIQRTGGGCGIHGSAAVTRLLLSGGVDVYGLSFSAIAG